MLSEDSPRHRLKRSSNDTEAGQLQTGENLCLQRLQHCLHTHRMYYTHTHIMYFYTHTHTHTHSMCVHTHRMYFYTHTYNYTV